MKKKFIVIQTNYQNGSLSRTGYGIALAQECDGVMLILEAIADLSCEPKSVEALVEYCNRCELSPVHLRDVVEDFLTLQAL